MANIILLLVIFMFVFAVIGVSLFAAESPQYFGNLETGILLKSYYLRFEKSDYNFVMMNEATKTCALVRWQSVILRLCRALNPTPF